MRRLETATRIVASAATIGTPIRRETRSALSPAMIVPMAMPLAWSPAVVALMSRSRRSSGTT
jgi:hypothetical protein